MPNLPVPSHPPDRPRSLARDNLRHPDAIKSVQGIIVPEPHIREDALERGYMGSMSEAEIDESKPVYVRLPKWAIEAMYRLALNEDLPYSRNPQNLIRHAIYELIYQCLLVAEEVKEAPEIVHFMESQRMLKENAHLAQQGLWMAQTLRSEEVFLAHAIQTGHTEEINRHLESLAQVYNTSRSDTWKMEFAGLISRSASVQAAINHAVQHWTGHKDEAKRKKAAHWEAWWAAITED